MFNIFFWIWSSNVLCVFFLKGWNCKAPSSIDTQKAQLIICCLFARCLFFSLLRLILLLCFTTDDQTTPSLSCTNCEKCKYVRNLLHSFIFCMEKLLVRREYLKFDWIFSKMKLNTVNVKISAEKYYSSVSLE